MIDWLIDWFDNRVDKIWIQILREICVFALHKNYFSTNLSLSLEVTMCERAPCIDMKRLCELSLFSFYVPSSVLSQVGANKYIMKKIKKINYIDYYSCAGVNWARRCRPYPVDASSRSDLVNVSCFSWCLPAAMFTNLTPLSKFGLKRLSGCFWECI